MNGKWILAACLLFLPARSPAAPVPPGDVTAAVETWVRGVAAEPRADATVERIEPYRDRGRVVAYIVSLRGGGFCIAGADDRLAPIASYSSTGTYDPACPGHQDALHDLSVRLARLDAAEAAGDPVLDQYRDKLRERRLDWQALIARRLPPSLAQKDGRPTPETMALPVTSLWHQLPPYNMYCPVLPPGTDTCVVGCVGTGTVQLMYYWKWPYTGVGSGTTTYNYWHTTSWISTHLAGNPGSIPDALIGRLAWTAYNGGTLYMNGYWDASFRYAAEHISENPAPAYLAALQTLYAMQTSGSQVLNCNFNTTYNWSVMHDRPNDPPDAGDQEAARISYHMAVANETGFGVLGSGSDHPHAIAALEDHFRYDPDAYSGPLSTNLMINDIQWLRPTQMSGPGHSWMVCGYDASVSPVQFLMNYGWEGVPLIWDTVDDIFPGDHDNMLQVAPLSVVRFVGNNGSGDGGPANPYRDLAEAAAQAPNGCTLIFKTATINLFAASSVVINRPMTLKGVDVTIAPQ